jgi:hypothetical protein
MTMSQRVFSHALFGVGLSGAAILAALAGCSADPTGSSSGNTTPDGGGADAQNEAPLEGLRADWREAAAGYLDGRVDAWLTNPPNIANVKCAMTCHTGFPATLARYTLTKKGQMPKADTLRQRFEARVAEGASATPFYGSNGDAKTKESFATEALLNAVALGMDDLWSGKPLSGTTKSAMDRMWATQSPDGSWAWLEFKLEPWETRNDFGAAISLVLLGSVDASASAGYEVGLAKVKTYLNDRLDKMAMHDRVTLLWSSSFAPGVITQVAREKIAAEVVAKQHEDGGFSAGDWGSGSRAAAVQGTTDGYATALATLALCTEASRAAETRKGLAWLAKNQQEDGSWPGQSVNTTSKQARTFMTDAATGFAALALTQCGKQ